MQRLYLGDFVLEVGHAGSGTAKLPLLSVRAWYGGVMGMAEAQDGLWGSAESMPRPSSIMTAFSQGVEGLQEHATALRDADFRISEDFAKDLQNALVKMQDRLDESIRNLGSFTERLPLGGHAYGQLAGEHTRKMIDGEPGSVLPVLKQLRKALDEAFEVLEAAKKKYAEYEESAAGVTNIEVD